MNCKPGDLAVIVKSIAGNEGKIVKCLRLAIGDRNFFPRPRWLIEQPVPDNCGGEIYTLADCALRPIRDQPGADETLSWLEVPSKVTA